jgi:hypothetical protein
MKKIVKYILALIVLTSCDDMLQEVPKNFVSRANYFQNESDAEGAIIGAYASIDRDYYGVTFYLFEELHGDYLDGRGSQAPLSVMNQVLDQNNIGRAATNWSNLYKGNNRANSVLANVPGIVDISDEAKNRIVAEAYFLRAAAYFNLVRGWGEVPLRLEESTDLSMLAAPRESVSKVYEQILSDAVEAEKNLPESVGSQTGRASVWAAKMLLAQVYLTLEDWSNAATKSDEVIASGHYSLVKVSEPNDFYKMYAVETHSEDIMSVHHSETRTSSIPTYLHRGNTYPYNYSGTGYYAWLPNMNSFIGDSWDNKDLRKSFNLYTRYVNENGDSVDLPSSSPILFKKFVSNSDGLNVYPVPVYRLTEAYLMYAEAVCMDENGPSALALERLNMIKRRAYGYDPNVPSVVDYPAGMDRDTFRETVLQERGYEFLLERRRWWDLNRTGKVKEAFAAIGKNFIDERFLWPIPEDEINSNPALTPQDQNPGY